MGVVGGSASAGRAHPAARAVSKVLDVDKRAVGWLWISGRCAKQAREGGAAQCRWVVLLNSAGGRRPIALTGAGER